MRIEETISWLEVDMDKTLSSMNASEKDALDLLKNRDNEKYHVYLAEESAVEFLKRRIPRRVIDRVTFYECPSCYLPSIEPYDSCCRGCGTKLEW